MKSTGAYPPRWSHLTGCMYREHLAEGSKRMSPSDPTVGSLEFPHMYIYIYQITTPKLLLCVAPFIADYTSII